MWMNDLLMDAGILDEGSAPLQTAKLQINNKGTVDLAKAGSLTRRSRHIEIRHHIIRDWVSKGEITIEHIAGTANRADGLTKPLAPDPYKTFVQAIGIRPTNTGATA
jgi:hypothetical protein